MSVLTAERGSAALQGVENYDPSVYHINNNFSPRPEAPQSNATSETYDWALPTDMPDDASVLERVWANNPAPVEQAPAPVSSEYTPYQNAPTRPQATGGRAAQETLAPFISVAAAQDAAERFPGNPSVDPIMFEMGDARLVRSVNHANGRATITGREVDEYHDPSTHYSKERAERDVQAGQSIRNSGIEVIRIRAGGMDTANFSGLDETNMAPYLSGRN